MAQMTDEQRQQTSVAAERVATKLKTFDDTLPADEQELLAVTLVHGLGSVNAQAAESAGYVVEAVAAALATQNDVHGQAMMIGGLWFTPPGDTHRTEIPPKYGPFGYDPTPRTPRRLPGEPRDA